MNIYFVVEGEQTERKVYSSWIGFSLPTYKKTSKIEAIEENNYYLFSSNGYPAIKNHIKNAITDITNINSNNTYKNFDMLVIIVDSEEISYEERKNEFESLLLQYPLPINVAYKIIVQHPCIETWFLGNKKAITEKPSDGERAKYIKHYNVRRKDPEFMQKPFNYENSLADYHLSYLKELLKEKKQVYSKREPATTMKEYYYKSLLSRAKKNKHIQSFLEVEELFEAIRTKS